MAQFEVIIGPKRVRGHSTLAHSYPPPPFITAGGQNVSNNSRPHKLHHWVVYSSFAYEKAGHGDTSIGPNNQQKQQALVTLSCAELEVEGR